MFAANTVDYLNPHDQMDFFGLPIVRSDQDRIFNAGSYAQTVVDIHKPEEQNADNHTVEEYTEQELDYYRNFDLEVDNILKEMMEDIIDELAKEFYEKFVKKQVDLPQLGEIFK